ncbi:Protein of unknown function [Aureimonas altamirensis DSM 21988]|uniref:DUF4054 domain-containing protein n=2 Tax=Aureimonas altamirensis TaxID=370622 RepID=A0A0P0YX60_9HYPH|nr:DUF4054 domain-containing protein [Aureimonas altamirensis]BAT26064.1 hypothetical protein [Aureimonas altamirensis]SHI80090.1 Protein of unknown function [Aureimonas altamirensis DSM 21988]
MPYIVPTVDEFLTRYPQFEAVEGDRLSAVMEEAVGAVGQPETTRWVEKDYQPAIMLLTAHMLTLEGALPGSLGAIGGEYAGPITREKVGEVETTYGGSGASGGGTDLSDPWGYSLTFYGRRFLLMMRANFSGPMVA